MDRRTLSLPENVTVDRRAAPDKYCAWLLRPFVDLGAFEDGPLYAEGIEHSWLAVVDTSRPRFCLQRILPAGFRTLLLRESNRIRFDLADPADLPKHLRTPRWEALCALLARWHDLSVESQCRIVQLLHALTLYEFIAGLVPLPSASLVRGDEAAIELAYWRISAQYMLKLPRRFADYREADLHWYADIAENAPHAVHAAFNAAVKIFVHGNKVGDASVEDLERHAGLMGRRLENAVRHCGDFTAGLLASRYHRALAYLPMRRGDQSDMVRQMELAEGYARGLRPSTPAEDLLYRENLHPLLESRAKEAAWLGDFQLALERVRAMVELDPHDPKSWLELGDIHEKRRDWLEAANAYLTAAMLGPPVGAMARFKAGGCYREMGQDAAAAFHFQQALEIDPLGLSTRIEIERFPETGQLASLKQWSFRKLVPSA